MSKKMVSLIIIILCVGAVLGLKVFIDAQRDGALRVDESRAKGSTEAPLQIVEYIDFQCPACARGALYLKKLFEDHPGLVRLEMKFFPLSGHTHGFLSARYARCAAQQGQFWPYHDALVSEQDSWRKLTDARPAFDLLAQRLSLDEKKLTVCLDDHVINEEILKDKAEGAALGIKSTPTYVLNGQLIVGHINLEKEINAFIQNQPTN